MTEIERIQALIIKHIPPSKTGDLSDVYICAKAISQYVIKARIEELGKLMNDLSGNKVNITIVGLMERIAQLKKGLEDAKHRTNG